MSVKKIKMAVTGALKTVMFHTGVFGIIRRVKPNSKAAILRYHAIVDQSENTYAHPTICLSEKQFEKHVRYFAQRYKIMSLDEIVEHLIEKKPLPANAVAFTFDDGYTDNLRATRILKKYGCSGTFYLTAACIDRQEPFWLSEVIYLVLKTNKKRIAISEAGQDLKLTLGKRDQRWSSVSKIVALIKGNNREVRESVRKQLREQTDDVSAANLNERVMLTWRQVKEMIADGMIMGGHTMTHLNLPNAGESDANLEITECKKLLEAKLGREIRHFSYPNSGPYEYYTQEVRDLVEASGYQSSTTSYYGFVEPGDDLFSLRRVRTVPSLVETVAGMELSKIF